MGLILVMLSLSGVLGAQEPAPPPAGVEACFECHDEKAAWHARGAHAGVDCASCHSGTAEHLADADALPGKPAAASCMACHQGGARHMIWSTSDHAPGGGRVPGLPRDAHAEGRRRLQGRRR